MQLTVTGALAQDFQRAHTNYQSILRGEKTIDQLNQNELRDLILLLGSTSSPSSTSCETGYRRCVSACENVTVLFDYSTGSYVGTDFTDFSSNCTDACSRGQNFCEDESDPNERCYEFKRTCRNSCPSDFFDYRVSEYRFITDAEDNCDDACRAGERACE